MKAKVRNQSAHNANQLKRSSKRYLRGFARQVLRKSPEELMGLLSPPVCDSIKEWCRSHPSADFRSVFPAGVIIDQPTRTLEPSLLPVYSERAQLPRPEKYFARIPNARIVGQTALIVPPDGEFAIESGVTRKVLLRDPAYPAPLLPAAKKLGLYFSIVPDWAKRHCSPKIYSECNCIVQDNPIRS